MKYLIILSLLVSSLQASAQAQNDNISNAMKDVKKVDDPLTQALDDLSKDDKEKMKETPKTINETPQQPSMMKQKYEITADKAVSVPADAEKKISQAQKREPLKLTKEESEMLKGRMKNIKDRPDISQDIENDKKEFNSVYTPSKARNKSGDGYVLERDTTKVLTKHVSVYDSLNLKICFNAGIQIVLDEDIATALQTVLLDDKIFFDSISFDNNRGAYVRLKQAVPEGMYWESSIRMVRKQDDKTYLINLIALPCPMGAYPFPKVVYLKDKNAAMGKTTKIMTPENTIIGLSEGLPRVQKNIVRVRDMVASSGSDWVTFGVEIQFPDRKTKTFDADMNKYFRFLNDLQVSQVQFKVDYLPIQSEYVTKARGVPTMRFEIKVNIDKSYILNDQFLYMMFIDKEEKHYQYIKIDTIPYFLSLKQRGFEL